MFIHGGFFSLQLSRDITDKRDLLQTGRILKNYSILAPRFRIIRLVTNFQWYAMPSKTAR